MVTIKHTLFLFPFLFTLFGSTCKKEGENCHHSIIITNKSSGDVVYATKARSGTTDLYNLQGKVLISDELHDANGKDCWENKLSKGRIYEFFIVDPSQFNDPTVFYSIDSIEIKNKILKRYNLTLDDLKNTNFKVTYP